MAVSRFLATDADFSLLQDSETLVLAPEELLSDADRSIVTVQATRAQPPCPQGITLRGTSSNDVLRGTGGSDLLEGRGGNDRLFGIGCDDRLFGGSGNDRLFGDRRNDELFGQNGRDELFGDFGNDRMFGGSGEDDLRGGNGADLLEGGADRDALFGGNGEDRLFGQGGRDLLLGGRNNDVLVGGINRDRMGGGGGNDRFVYNSFDDAGDTILDFDRRRDVLDLGRLFRGNDFPSADPFRDYVIIVRELEDVTIIRVDADGNRGDAPFRTLATLENVEFDDIGRSNFAF